MSEPLNLLHLSDETLIHIFMFVDATDLYHLSFVCEKLNNLVQDEFLWVWCEARNRPNHSRKVDYCINNITGKSKTILLAGCTEILNSLSPTQIHKLTSLEMLTVLAIENIHFDGSVVPLKRFPAHLKELSLSGSYVTHYGDFFRMCSTRLINLRVMILDRCRWFDSHTLVPLSKLPSLEILSFYLCKQLNDEDMSYISLAGRHGFKSLKILDLRFTGYGDEIIRSFTRNKGIAEIYFQSYSRSYWLDCAKWKLKQLRGELGIHPWNPDAMDDIDDTVPEVVLNKYGEDFNINSYNLQRVTDAGLRTFRYTENSSSLDYLCPESVLYVRPYGKCKCGFVDKTGPIVESHIGNSNFEQAALEELIEKLLKRRSTPNVNFLEPRPTCNWIGTRGPRSTEEVTILQQLSPLLITLLNNRYPSPMGDIIEVSLNRTLDVMLGRPPSEYRIQSLQRHAPRQENPANQNQNHACVLKDKMRTDLSKFCDNWRNHSQRQDPSTSKNEPPIKKRKYDEPSTSKRKIDDDDSTDVKKTKMNDCSPSCSKDKGSDDENFGIFTDCVDSNQGSSKEVVEDVSNDTSDLGNCVEVVEVVTTIIKDVKVDSEDTPGVSNNSKNEDKTMYKAECSKRSETSKTDEVGEAPLQEAVGRNREIEDWNEKKQYDEEDEDMVVVVLQLQEEDQKQLEKNFKNVEKRQQEGRTTTFFENCSKKLDCLKGNEEIKVCVILGQINSPKNNTEDEAEKKDLEDSKDNGECCSTGPKEEVLNEDEGSIEELKSEDHRMDEDCEENKTEDTSKLSEVISYDENCGESSRTESTDNQNDCEDKSDNNVKEDNFTSKGIQGNCASLVSCEDNLITVEENCDNSKSEDVNHECVNDNCQETSKKSEETCKKSKKIEVICEKSEVTYNKSEETCKNCEGKYKENEDKKSEETSKSEDIVCDNLSDTKEEESVSKMEKNKEDTHCSHEELNHLENKEEIEKLGSKEETEKEENCVQIEESKITKDFPNEVSKENGINNEIEENIEKNVDCSDGEEEKTVEESVKKDEGNKKTDDEYVDNEDHSYEENSLDDDQDVLNRSVESDVQIVNFTRNVGAGYLSLDEMSDERSIEVNIGEDEEVNEEHEVEEHGVDEKQGVDEEHEMDEVDEENKDEESEEDAIIKNKVSNPVKNQRNEENRRNLPGSSTSNGKSSTSQSKTKKRPRSVSSSSSSSSSSYEKVQPNIEHLFRAAEMQMIIRNPRIEPTSIRYLSLRGYKKVTDEALKHLSHLQLDLIDVTYTGVTVGGVKRFIETNPSCRVVHESACKCGPRMHF